MEPLGWLAATVFVARDALDRAERDVDSGLAVAAVESHEAAPFSVVALHWLKGLVRLCQIAELLRECASDHF